MRLTLTDGPQNAQAILVDPTSLDLYIFPKSDCSELYRVPYAQSLTQATPMSRLLFPFDKVTSAEIATSNKEILVRTYTQLLYYTRQPGGAVVTALKRTLKRRYLIKCWAQAKFDTDNWTTRCALPTTLRRPSRQRQSTGQTPS